MGLFASLSVEVGVTLAPPLWPINHVSTPLCWLGAYSSTLQRSTPLLVPLYFILPHPLYPRTLFHPLLTPSHPLFLSRLITPCLRFPCNLLLLFFVVVFFFFKNVHNILQFQCLFKIHGQSLSAPAADYPCGPCSASACQPIGHLC